MAKVGDTIKVLQHNGIPGVKYLPKIGGTYTVKCTQGDAVFIYDASADNPGSRCPCGQHQWVLNKSQYKITKAMSNKFFEVLEDTPVWVKGAIIENSSSNGGYVAVDEAFHAHENVGSEYLSATVVEDPANAKFFKRVYKINLGAKVVYRTREAAREFLKGEFKE